MKLKFSIIFFSIILFLTKTYTAFCQTTTTGAEIKFDKFVHDYGTIYQNDNGTTYFTFTNTGNEPLVLSKVMANCGCTVPTWPKEPILPEQSSSIQVVYDTKRLGPINKQITVISNATNSTVYLSIKGNVIKKPEELLPLKEIDNSAIPVAK